MSRCPVPQDSRGVRQVMPPPPQRASRALSEALARQAPPRALLRPPQMDRGQPDPPQGPREQVPQPREPTPPAQPPILRPFPWVTRRRSSAAASSASAAKSISPRLLFLKRPTITAFSSSSGIPRKTWASQVHPPNKLERPPEPQAKTPLGRSLRLHNRTR